MNSPNSTQASAAGWSVGLVLTAMATLAPTALYAQGAENDTVRLLDPVVVTAPRMQDAGRIESDPRQPHLPLPAQDGGAYLKSIPGFANSRKGGMSGDPELRGQGGSRLRILLDDTPVLGAGGGRMDPPTTYVFPEAHDRVEVLKGPQSVRYGAAGAGIVRFQRDIPRLDEPTVEGRASFTGGSFGRLDQMANVTAGDRTGYVRMRGVVSSQENYRDGAGDRVHSSYERWAASGSIGWTPDPDTAIEINHDRSDGEAAYDDRPLDGTRFDRTGYQIRMERDRIASWLPRVEARLFYDDNEHEMDNFRLRDVPEGDDPRIQFPSRQSVGGRIAAELLPDETLEMIVGVDFESHEHRGGLPETGDEALRFRSRSVGDTAEIDQYGVFAELQHALSPVDLLDTGVRVDRNEATARRKGGPVGGYGGAEPGTRDDNTLVSAFLRYTRKLQSVPWQLYAGIGRAERAPDFWERGGPAMREGGFEIDPEVLTQLDVGAGYASRSIEASVAAFYGQFDDYLLIDYQSLPGMGSRPVNVDATHYGIEADVTRRFTPVWSATATLAAVRADNDTDGEPLAQTPPVEMSLSVDYDREQLFAGVLGRAVARQDRVHDGFGTIYSEDQGETGSFATLSLYGGYRFTEHVAATLGVDNLLDRTYAEHIQRAGGGDLTPEHERMNEPGRNFWGRVSASF